MQSTRGTALVAYDSYCDSPIPLPPDEELIFSHQSTSEAASKAEVISLYVSLIQIAVCCNFFINEIITLPLKPRITFLVVISVIFVIPTGLWAQNEFVREKYSWILITSKRVILYSLKGLFSLKSRAQSIRSKEIGYVRENRGRIEVVAKDHNSKIAYPPDKRRYLWKPRGRQGVLIALPGDFGKKLQEILIMRTRIAFNFVRHPHIRGLWIPCTLMQG